MRQLPPGDSFPVAAPEKPDAGVIQLLEVVKIHLAPAPLLLISASLWDTNPPLQACRL
jgi:hypothetical protein